MDEHGSDSNVEDVPVSVTTDAVALVVNAAFPASAEDDYLYGWGLPYVWINPTSLKSLAFDRKALSSSESKLRRRIAVKGRRRKLHKFEIQTVQDLDIYDKYESLLAIQCGSSLFRKEPAETWEQLNSRVYKDTVSETLYYRCSDNDEFRICIPKVSIVVEFRNDEIIKSVTEPRGALSCIPTLANLAFRPLYNAAITNLEEEMKHSDPQQNVQKNIQELPPITSFIEENPIDRAIRLAKEKYRKRKGDGEPAKQKLETTTADHNKDKGTKRKLIEDSPVKRDNPTKKSRTTISSVLQQKKYLPKFRPDVHLTDNISHNDSPLVGPSCKESGTPKVTHPHRHQRQNEIEMNNFSVTHRHSRENDIVTLTNRCKEKVASKQTGSPEQIKSRNLPKLKNGYKEMAKKETARDHDDQTPPRRQKSPTAPKPSSSTNEHPSLHSSDHTQVKPLSMPSIFDLFPTNEPLSSPRAKDIFDLNLPSIFDLLPPAQCAEEIGEVDGLAAEAILSLDEVTDEFEDKAAGEADSPESPPSPLVSSTHIGNPPADTDDETAGIFKISDDTTESSPPLPSGDDEVVSDISQVSDDDRPDSLRTSPLVPYVGEAAIDDDEDPSDILKVSDADNSDSSLLSPPVHVGEAATDEEDPSDILKVSDDDSSDSSLTSPPVPHKEAAMDDDEDSSDILKVSDADSSDSSLPSPPIHVGEAATDEEDPSDILKVSDDDSSDSSLPSPPVHVGEAATDEEDPSNILKVSDDDSSDSSLTSPPVPHKEAAMDDNEDSSDILKVSDDVKPDFLLRSPSVPHVADAATDDRDDLDILEICVDDEEMDWLV